MKQIVYFNSKFRDNYYKTRATKFDYTFPYTIRNITSVSLSSIEIPNSWYNFSKKKGNTNFFIRTHAREGGKIEEKMHELIIPEGLWSSIELVDYLKREYFDNEGEVCYIKMEIDPILLKVYFELEKNAPDDFVFDLIFKTNKENPILTAGWTLGFRAFEYININNRIISEALFDGLGGSFFYFALTDYNSHRTENDIIFLNNIYLEKDIIGKIYTDGNFRILIEDENNQSNFKKREYYGPVNINKISVKLLDEYGQELCLNGMDFSFTLQFEIL